jgi:anti-sigma regulatory factor (Ser/Thr protein kinase)
VHLPDESSETGRGLYLIQAVMDRVDYERNGAGNRLRLVKKRG